LTTVAATAVRAATAAMGTRFELVVAGDEHELRPVLEEIIRDIEELHARFTRFARDSLLAHINRTAHQTPVRLDRGSFALFAAAQQVASQSGGAFDVTLGSGAFILDPIACTIAFDRPGVTLDLGAIAKGYALDRAAASLREAGVVSALLHGGTSSVLAIGAPPDADAWRIGLARGHQRPWVDLRDAALSVSRPFAQTFDGKAHIRDPRSDTPVQERRFALVIGPSAALADAWSTALSVLGARPAELSAEWFTSIEIEHE
jgi:FAD:protein FMN transferase